MITVASHSLRARSAILSRLRAAPSSAPVAEPEIPGSFGAVPVGDAEPRIERFMRHARSWRAEVIETTATAWPAQLAELVEQRGLQQLLAGRGTAIADALAHCLPPQRLQWYDQALSTFKQELFTRINAGITTTLGAVAGSGSLLLRPSVAEPRSLSLVPPIHIAVLHESSVHDTLLAAMQHHRWVYDMPSNLLLVTGPSKTADIQRMLVYGAHGPKELIILLIRAQSAAVAAEVAP